MIKQEFTVTCIRMQHFILATLPVIWLLKQTCAQSSLYVEMFMGPENKDLFYVEEGGSKNIECCVLGAESLTINLTWSGPSVNESLRQKTSINYPEKHRQQVGNWLNITQFSDAAVGTYTCRAITSKPQDLSRSITIAKSCEIGKFGPPSCTKSCSEHCKTGPDGAKGRNCDHINGTCLNGCLEGYTGSVCADCEIGKFDPSSCTKNCSKHCNTGPDGAKGRKCDHKNGTCLYGCLKGYTGPMCTVKPKEPGDDIVGIVVGIIIAFIVLVVLAVIAYRKRKQIQRKFNIGKKAELTDGQPQHHQQQMTDNAQNGDQEGQNLLSSSNTSRPEERVQGARPKQETKSQRPQESPTSTQLNSGARERERDLAERERGVTERERGVAERERGVAERERRLAERERELHAKREDSKEAIKEKKKKLVKGLNETINDLRQKLIEKDDTISNMHGRIEDLQVIRTQADEAGDDNTQETLDVAERQAMKELSSEKHKMEEMTQELKATKAELEALRQMYEDRNVDNPAASRQPTDAANDPTLPSTSNFDLGVYNKGNTDGPSQLDENEVEPVSESYMQDHTTYTV